ncbi:MAG TPA: dihydroorotase [Planctomycetota bacterium]|nr:dihydroorotase [Planctomycetota bacterium]
MSERFTLIRGGRVVDPATARDEIADVLVEGERIRVVGVVEPLPAGVPVDIIDARGLIVTPGLIDMHVHLREPGNEEEETILSGSRAAVAGGVTTLTCFPNTEPAIDNEAAAEFVVLQGKRAGLANVLPVGAVTMNRDGQQLSEMGGLVRGGAVAFSDADRSLRSAEVMRRGLLYAKMFDTPVIAHCEDPDLRGMGVMNYGKTALRLGLQGTPDAAEDIVVARDIRLAAITLGRLHISHMSTKGSLDLLREAKLDGVDVTGEVTPPHFSLTEESLVTYDPNFKLVPPLRTSQDVEALVRGLEEGVIDVIASGHAPHSLEEKQLEFLYAPPGVVGLETLFAVSYTVLVERHGFPLLKLIEKMTLQPARILRLSKERGSLEPGKLADISLFDVTRDRIIRPTDFESKSRNTCFEGWSVRGTTVHVLVGGRRVVEAGRIVTGRTPER